MKQPKPEQYHEKKRHTEDQFPYNTYPVTRYRMILRKYLFTGMKKQNLSSFRRDPAQFL